jgi:hypothetical protein
MLHHEGDLLTRAATAPIGRFLPAQEVILRSHPDGHAPRIGGSRLSTSDRKYDPILGARPCASVGSGVAGSARASWVVLWLRLGFLGGSMERLLQLSRASALGTLGNCPSGRTVPMSGSSQLCGRALSSACVAAVS